MLLSGQPFPLCATEHMFGHGLKPSRPFPFFLITRETSPLATHTHAALSSAVSQTDGGGAFTESQKWHIVTAENTLFACRLANMTGTVFPIGATGYICRRPVTISEVEHCTKCEEILHYMQKRDNCELGLRE